MSFWSKEVLLVEVPKTDLVCVRVYKCEREGKPYINIREFFRGASDSDIWKASGKAGITLRGDIAEAILPAFTNGVKLSFDEVEELLAQSSQEQE
ncbi:hypothetical protein HSE3_gp032 [Bacillus phage vB_BceM-HSE3]|nr:hypothetical protein HSE3_gp032 [Bacillus phage vB_BceM-HSE3]